MRRFLDGLRLIFVGDAVSLNEDGTATVQQGGVVLTLQVIHTRIDYSTGARVKHCIPHREQPCLALNDLKRLFLISHDKEVDTSQRGYPQMIRILAA
mgnify:CR=1